MSACQADCVWPLGATLGEGPVWHVASQTLWFTDIKGRQLHAWHPASAQGRSHAAPDQPGFAQPMAQGAWLVGLPGGLHRLDPASGQWQLLARIEADRPGNRLNDATVGPDGTLWFGSMDDAEQAACGALYSWRAGVLRRHDDHIPITNGPVVTPDGRTLYHTETLARRVMAFDVQPDGSLHNKRLHLDLSGIQGYPDGSTLDAEGCLWVAFFGGGAVQRFAPDGRLLQRVALPCSNVTKLAFGGSDGCTAFITTARLHLSAEQLAAQPLAGGLFAFHAAVAGQVPGQLPL